jgi:hypothetical protein
MHYCPCYIYKYIYAPYTCTDCTYPQLCERGVPILTPTAAEYSNTYIGKPVGRPTQHKGGREVGGGSGAKSRREIWPLSLERGAARVAAAR